MKSQGLPINFIVLAAVAILILILIIGFVIGGGTAMERSIAPGVARSNCDRWCSDLQARAAIIAPSDGFEEESSFCKNTQIVDGVPAYCDKDEGLNLNIRCLLTFQDGSSRYADC